MIYLSQYMERRTFIVTLLTAGIFMFGAIYIYSHILILHGAVKERKDKECVGATVIQNWENTLNIAQAICVEAQNNHLEEIKIAYELQIKRLEKDVKYWEDSYHYIKFKNNDKNK